MGKGLRRGGDLVISPLTLPSTCQSQSKQAQRHSSDKLVVCSQSGLGRKVQSWQGELESSSVRHSSWLSGSDEKDIGLGVDTVSDDEREDEDAEAHDQRDELKFFAGNEEYPSLDVFPAALGPRRIFCGAPLTQLKGRGQGPRQSYCGADTPWEPLCLVGIPRALYP